MSKAGALCLIVLATAATVLYSVVSHHLVASQDRSEFAYLFALASIYLIAVGVAYVSHWRKSILIGATIAVLIAWWFRNLGVWDPSWVYLFQHLGANLALAGVFGVTLTGGRAPLVTRLARLVHQGFPEQMVPYTRQVTIAWMLFFLLVCALSILLFAFAPLHWWSIFINFLSWPMVIVMFAAEYLVRRLRFRNFEHVGILAGAQAFSRSDKQDPMTRR